MKTGALSADVHCCAVMPREASPLLPEHLQPLHAAICDARDQGLDADALPFLEALASTLHAANSLLGGGDARTWTTVRRAREDEFIKSVAADAAAGRRRRGGRRRRRRARGRRATRTSSCAGASVPPDAGAAR